MIEIICDQYGLYSSSKADSIVTETSQFEDEFFKIKSCAESGISLRIIVRNPILFKWFDAASRYGVRKTILDPVAMLTDKLHQPVVPEYLQANPQWIVELNLLEKQAQPVRGESAENWLKRVLLGEIWKKETLNSTEDFSSLFAYFIEHNEPDLHPLEQKLITEQLHRWKRNISDKKELFSWLNRNPFRRARCIVWEQLLSLFPEDKIAAWLQQDNIWYELSQFPNRHALPSLSLSVQLPENIAIFPRYFLREKWNISIEEAIPFISGTFDFEKNFLLEQLQQQLQNEVALNLSVYKKLLKFNFPEVVSLARKLVPARKPSSLPIDSNVKKVQTWIANEYLPFYNSCSLLGKVDSTEPYVNDFEQWLEKHYTDMLFGEGLSYRQTAQIKDCLLADNPVLLIIFDGLDYLCAYDELLPVMQDNGFFPLNDLTPFFSFLPTQTFIAKPTLVAGKMKSQIPDEVPTASFYKDLLQKHLSVSGDTIRSKTDKDGSLLELIQEPAQVYLYLDNYLDRELLHSNIRQHNRQKKYGVYVRKQAEEIVQCLRDFKEMYGKSLHVVISSDHGYTIIPKSAAIIEVPGVTNNKARTLSGYKPEDIENLTNEQIWRLNPNLFGLNQEMILPRGYACFNKRPLGATHGGCTPQEMAIPWFFLGNDRPTSLEALIFSLEGEIFRKRADNELTLSILNPNNYSITLIEVDAGELKISSALPQNIGKNEVTKLKSSFNASAINESTVEFSIKYHLKSLTGKMEEGLTFKVPTTGAMSTEFDDDFEF